MAEKLSDESTSYSVPRICFEGELANPDRLFLLEPNARLLAQFQIGDHCLLFVAEDFFSMLIDAPDPLVFTSNVIDLLMSFPSLGAAAEIRCFWIGPDLTIEQFVNAKSRWRTFLPRKYAPYEGRDLLYLIPGVERMSIKQNYVRFHLFRGPVLEIGVTNEGGVQLLPDEMIVLKNLVPWWPHWNFLNPWWQASVEMEKADYPITVRVNVVRSWLRFLARPFRKRPKPEDFPTIDWDLGWTDYQGAEIFQELKAAGLIPHMDR